MTGGGAPDAFAVDWLALREPADLSAQSAEILDRLCAHLGDRPRLQILDLGSGTGASVRALAGRLPGTQHWTLVDHAAGSLAAAEAHLAPWLAAHHLAPRVRVACIQADLATQLAVPAGTDLIVCSALLDLASAAWIERLVLAAAESGAILLDRLTVTAEHGFSPVHPDDAAILAAFARDQQRDKGLGPAAGPQAPAALAAAGERVGLTVVQRASPWQLSAEEHAPLIRALIDLYAAVAGRWGLDPHGWRAARHGNTQSLLVGHADTLLLP